MSEIKRFKTNKIGLEDLALGKGSEMQERWLGLRQVTHIRIICPVENFQELKALDTDKFGWAMVAGNFYEHDGQAGYFYFYDPNGSEKEELPNIIIPSSNKGRWKVLPYGFEAIAQFVKQKVEEFAGTLMPDIVKDIVENHLQVILPPWVSKEVQDEIAKQLPVEIERLVPPLVEQVLNVLAPIKVEEAIDAMLPAKVQEQIDLLLPQAVRDEIAKQLIPAIELILPPMVQQAVTNAIANLLPPAVNDEINKQLPAILAQIVPPLVEQIAQAIIPPIAEQAVKDEVNKIDFDAKVDDAVNKADIPGKVDDAIVNADIQGKVDDAIVNADIPKKVEDEVNKIDFDAKVDDAVNKADIPGKVDDAIVNADIPKIVEDEVNNIDFDAKVDDAVNKADIPGKVDTEIVNKLPAEVDKQLAQKLPQELQPIKDKVDNLGNKVDSEAGIRGKHANNVAYTKYQVVAVLFRRTDQNLTGEDRYFTKHFIALTDTNNKPVTGRQDSSVNSVTIFFDDNNIQIHADWLPINKLRDNLAWRPAPPLLDDSFRALRGEYNQNISIKKYQQASVFLADKTRGTIEKLSFIAKQNTTNKPVVGDVDSTYNNISIYNINANLRPNLGDYFLLTPNVRPYKRIINIRDNMTFVWPKDFRGKIKFYTRDTDATSGRTISTWTLDFSNGLDGGSLPNFLMSDVYHNVDIMNTNGISGKSNFAYLTLPGKCLFTNNTQVGIYFNFTFPGENFLFMEADVPIVGTQIYNNVTNLTYTNVIAIRPGINNTAVIDSLGAVFPALGRYQNWDKNANGMDRDYWCFMNGFVPTTFATGQFQDFYTYYKRICNSSALPDFRFKFLVGIGSGGDGELLKHKFNSPPTGTQTGVAVNFFVRVY